MNAMLAARKSLQTVDVGQKRKLLWADKAAASTAPKAAAAVAAAPAAVVADAGAKSFNAWEQTAFLDDAAGERRSKFLKLMGAKTAVAGGGPTDAQVTLAGSSVQRMRDQPL